MSIVKKPPNKPVLNVMTETVTGSEECYVLACCPRQLEVRLHLIADTAIGITVWGTGQLELIVTAPFNFDLTWYIWQTGTREYCPKLKEPANTMNLDGAQRMIRALKSSDEAAFLKAVKTCYGAQLASGLTVLPNQGEIAKVYIRQDAALYLFPGSRNSKLKLPGAHFRVL